ncbi:MAG TPA: alkaline phosphatase family protein [Candidatus Sulfotelmatobacter sp.]|nr:alkaline phosphatase family protein [Candidatus Sulfotelmatobacter sp.]
MLRQDSVCRTLLGILLFVSLAGAAANAASYTLTMTVNGTGSGTVTSNPAGISCKPTCSAAFAAGTIVKLTAVPATGSYLAGWSGACKGTSNTCTLTLNSNLAVTATFNLNQTVKVLNHIIFMAQENRSLDHYWGALREYWRQNKFSDISYDGLPQFNPVSGAAPLYGPPPTNPGCDPNYPPPNDCVEDGNSPSISSYKLITECIENPSPSWNESHVDWNLSNPVSSTPTLDGYVYTSGHDARNIVPQYYDTNGIRSMGYYDGTDLNYYYYMASRFATSDRWFAPAMARSQPNRDYLIAATSQGYVYPIGTNSKDQSLLTAQTIFQKLQNAGISWKIYVNPQNTPCASNPTAQCLLTQSYIQDFQWGQTIPANYPNNLVPISQYFTDLQNGTLPQVAMIEPASAAGLDEHGSDSDQYPIHIQLGAQYVESLINALMTSSSWKDSAFILTYDEGGGLYDHVPAHSTVNPDGIKPVDLQPTDICTGTTGPNCDFTYTGYRVPLLVVSPYARKHYVNHTAADYTAILRLIETRFGLTSLTRRDANQQNMTGFFNFNFPPWVTPPTPPAQYTGGSCYLNQLP